MTCAQKIKSVEAKSISPYQEAKMSIAYIDYRTLDDEFYPLKRVCHLLEFDKLTLKEKCEAYAIRPQRNEVGEWGLTRYDLRKLHHTLYHEDRKNSGSQKDEGPWA